MTVEEFEALHARVVELERRLAEAERQIPRAIAIPPIIQGINTPQVSCLVNHGPEGCPGYPHPRTVAA